MKSIAAHILFILTFLMPGFAGYSQESPGARATVDRNQILIGEPIQLSLEAHVPSGSNLNWFRIDTIPHFEFVDKGALDSAQSGGQKIYRQKLIITSFDSGSLVIPSMVLEEGNNKMITDSIPIEVGFAPFDANKDYHDIKDIINVENPYVKYIIWIVAGICLISTAAVIFFVQKRPKIIPGSGKLFHNLSPYDEARQALQDLQKQRLPEQGQVKLYYTMLNDILRLFVLHKLQMSSLEKTNEELIIQLRQLNISPHQFAQLSGALRMSDFVKFAKYQPDKISNEQNFEIIEMSVDILNEIEQ
jgi:hypothetical protein